MAPSVVYAFLYPDIMSTATLSYLSDKFSTSRPRWIVSDQRRHKMCKYRYHYYSHCQHQELLCADLCDRSEPLLNEAGRATQDAFMERANGDHDDGTNTTKPSNTEDLSFSNTSAHGCSVIPQQGVVGTIHHDPSFAQHRTHHQPTTRTAKHHQSSSWPSTTQRLETREYSGNPRSFRDVRIVKPLISTVHTFLVQPWRRSSFHQLIRYDTTILAFITNVCK